MRLFKHARCSIICLRKDPAPIEAWALLTLGMGPMDQAVIALRGGHGIQGSRGPWGLWERHGNTPRNPWALRQCQKISKASQKK